jgi:hypothetical protein
MKPRIIRTRAYKLFHVRSNGTLGSLFIDRRAVVPVGPWLEAEDKDTRGFHTAHRPGWHCTAAPEAPHIKMYSDGQHRAWYHVEIENVTVYERTPAQGGTWYVAQRMRVIGPVE